MCQAAGRACGPLVRSEGADPADEVGQVRVSVPAAAGQRPLVLTLPTPCLNGRKLQGSTPFCRGRAAREAGHVARLGRVGAGGRRPEVVIVERKLPPQQGLPGSQEEGRADSLALGAVQHVLQLVHGVAVVHQLALPVPHRLHLLHL